ncbi:hypothetical protein LOTGIDRAFT_170714 [Lottia gigantea]|uniref:Uncharacterized protein n=1 Tax=Lottia gigantea TaxID=225164 RepID=V4AJV3_LOTGI|nr:hypothetical protein LOTGIDRAFT_170714 [Lottia gigantea]ESP04469.1 hypothetical protein LOTGIDRAFT_170714 [Lottia gigantea]
MNQINLCILISGVSSICKRNLHELRKHPSSGQSGKSSSKKHISEQDLHSKSDRHLNIQLLKTDEELKNVEKELKRLKESLARNQTRDHGAAIKIQAKITSLEDYKRKLESSEQTLSRHRQRRTDHKKLTIF